MPHDTPYHPEDHYHPGNRDPSYDGAGPRDAEGPRYSYAEDHYDKLSYGKEGEQTHVEQDVGSRFKHYCGMTVLEYVQLTACTAIRETTGDTRVCSDNL
jgi:hypothetical protein